MQRAGVPRNIHGRADGFTDTGSKFIANSCAYGSSHSSSHSSAHTCADVRAGGLRHRGLVSFLELFITVR
jgi:hypothetical protein